MRKAGSAARNPNRCPTHPGALPSEVIAATGKSKAEIAALPGVSRQHLYDILKERKRAERVLAQEIKLPDQTGHRIIKTAKT